MNIQEFFTDNASLLVMIGFAIFIFLLVLLITIRRQRRLTPEQREAMTKTGKFQTGIFILLLLVFVVAWFGMSMYFSYKTTPDESLSENTVNDSGVPIPTRLRGDGKCDVCGSFASYILVSYELIGGEKTEERVVNEYCASHAMIYVFIHPLSAIIGLINSDVDIDLALVGFFAIFFWVGLFLLAIDISRKPYKRVTKTLIIFLILALFVSAIVLI